MAALSERVDFVVDAIPPDLVAVSVLGSFADGGEEELERFLRAWTAPLPGVDAEVEPDDPRPGAVVPLPRPPQAVERRTEPQGAAAAE